MQVEQTDSDPLLFLSMSAPGDLPRRAGYFYAFGLTGKTEETKETMFDGSTQYETGSNYVFLLIPETEVQVAAQDWNQHLAEAYFEAKNNFGLPISAREATSFAMKIREVLNGTKTIDNYGSPLEESRARSIAVFLEPRIEMIARLTRPGSLEVAVATVDQHLSSLVAV